ncbi:hypothetical protein WJX72_007932 [[Myrmecia] bisecta]|uniref:Negatively light-regulated protein n=1 Tax=[Myrmecia] bisecta TaxID=41462 RepID=A0AAW1R8C4_9CHLO
MSTKPPPSAPKTQAEVEKEQETLLKAKYGGLQPKKKLMPKDHKFFDSADWALAKQGVKTESSVMADSHRLEPKLEPTVAAPRRVSHLGDEDMA